MRQVGGFNFPESDDDLDTWQPTVIYKALSMRILCAATTRIEGAWSAYIGVVPGMKHSQEFYDVLKYGDPLPYHVASALFSEFEEVPYNY